MLLHIVLNLGVGCPILKFGHIHIFQRELNPNLFRVDLALGKQDNRLDVLRLREQVYWAELGGAPAEAGEGGDVAGEGLGVAADVDYPAGGHFGHGGDALGRAAGAGAGRWGAAARRGAWS